MLVEPIIEHSQIIWRAILTVRLAGEPTERRLQPGLFLMRGDRA
jgi:hypothetical protein